jgi:predicted transcriptional regulator
MIFDMDEDGLHTLFKPYQALLMEHIWELNREGRVGVNSGEAHRFLEGTPEKKSRASVINFLNEMVDEGVLEFEKASGKGGYHRVYYPKMNKEGFAEYIIKMINDKLKEIFI